MSHLIGVLAAPSPYFFTVFGAVSDCMPMPLWQGKLLVGCRMQILWLCLSHDERSGGLGQRSFVVSTQSHVSHNCFLAIVLGSLFNPPSLSHRQPVIVKALLLVACLGSWSHSLAARESYYMGDLRCRSPLRDLPSAVGRHAGYHAENHMRARDYLRECTRRLRDGRAIPRACREV